MELKIGAKLAGLRRERGLTQEQLAERLGVSAPAVSKWETDNSYPDITLLCPLARALGTNVDTLLRFEEQLPNEAVMGKVNAILEMARQDGWEAGETALNELLRQYPNSEALKYNAALAQEAFRLLYPDADQEAQKHWTARKVELLADVRASGKGAYWQAATLQLAQTAVMENRLDEAEGLVKELPDQGVDTTLIEGQIFVMRGEPEEALKAVQKRLYAQVWQVQTSLSTLLALGVLPEMERQLKVCRLYQEVDSLFGLGGISEGLFLEVYLRAGRWEEAADWLDRYVDTMLGTVEFPKPGLFSPGVETERKPASSREMLLLLLKQLQEETVYQPVLEYETGRAALEKLKAGLASCGEAAG